MRGPLATLVFSSSCTWHYGWPSPCACTTERGRFRGILPIHRCRLSVSQCLDANEMTFCTRHFVLRRSTLFRVPPLLRVPLCFAHSGLCAPPARLLVREAGRALLDKGAHSDLLVVARKGGVEEGALGAEPLRESRLEGDVDACLGHGDNRRRHGRNPRRRRECVVEQRLRRHHAAHQPPSRRFVGADHVACEDELHRSRLA
mmetsp:Transcript_50463/g.116487  ORF Transcript_50463/g.116487 Transcript_50463/m.116487 type:complete len:202 (+) Transcript_50463:125-730(+)